MKPEEKAKELISKFAPKCSGNSQEILNHELAKQCSIILCNEVLDVFNFAHIGYGKNVIGGLQRAKIKKWTAIKKEIEKL